MRYSDMILLFIARRGRHICSMIWGEAVKIWTFGDKYKNLKVLVGRSVKIPSKMKNGVSTNPSMVIVPTLTSFWQVGNVGINVSNIRWTQHVLGISY